MLPTRLTTKEVVLLALIFLAHISCTNPTFDTSFGGSFDAPSNPSSGAELSNVEGLLPAREMYRYNDQLQSASIPQIPLELFQKYFTVDDNAEKFLRRLHSAGLLPGRPFIAFDDEPTTLAPMWTRPTTPKDTLVHYFEQTLDAFLNGKFQPKAPKSYLLDNDYLLQRKKEMAISNVEKNRNRDGKSEEFVEGSGEEPVEANEHSKINKTLKIASEQGAPTESSIVGIPSVVPFIPKVPLELFDEAERYSPLVKKISNRPEVPQGGFGPIKPTKPDSEIRRHPGNILKDHEWQPKTMSDEYEFGDKPSYKRGFVSSLLDFLGFQLQPQADQPPEFDRVLTDWILEHSPNYQTRAEKVANIKSSYDLIQRFISEPVATPLCSSQPEVVDVFDVDAFVGEWFQVMYSPMLASSGCQIFAYNLIERSALPDGVGSVFQTLQYSLPSPSTDLTSTPILKENKKPSIVSGHATLRRPGQFSSRRSNSPEEIIVNVVHVGERNRDGKYEYAILSVNCNYPLFVIARDPYTFKQKYEETVNQVLWQKGLVSRVSRILNILSPIDPDLCRLPKSLFNIDN